MVPKRLVFLISVVACGLTACPIDVIDVPVQDGPYIEVSPTDVKVGKPVRVNLSVTWVNGTFRDHVLEGQALGAYFCKTLVMDDSLGQICEEEIQPADLDSLKLIEGETFEKNFGSVLVESHQNLRLTHSFTFTSTEPLSIYPTAFFRLAPDVYDHSGIYLGERVTFRD